MCGIAGMSACKCMCIYLCIRIFSECDIKKRKILSVCLVTNIRIWLTIASKLDLKILKYKGQCNGCKNNSRYKKNNKILKI